MIELHRNGCWEITYICSEAMWQKADWRSRIHPYCWIGFKKFLRKKIHCKQRISVSHGSCSLLMGILYEKNNKFIETSAKCRLVMDERAKPDGKALFTSGPMFLNWHQPLRLSEEYGHLERAPCKAWCSVTSNGVSWSSGHIPLQAFWAYPTGKRKTHGGIIYLFWPRVPRDFGGGAWKCWKETCGTPCLACCHHDLTLSMDWVKCWLRNIKVLWMYCSHLCNQT